MIIEKDGVKIIITGDRTVVVKGIGKMFMQEGFPLSLSFAVLTSHGYEISIYHLVDELMRHYLDSGTLAYKVKDKVLSTLKECVEDDKTVGINMEEVAHYISSDYEKQRQMIFTYLWGQDPSIEKLSTMIQ